MIIRPYMVFFVLTVFFILSPCYAAFEPRDWGARSAAMGGLGGITADDITALPLNPSIAGLLPKFTAGATGYQLFPGLDGLEAISSIGLGIGLPTEKIGSFGLWYNTFGLDLYREHEIMLAHSFVLFRRISLGYGLKVLDLEMQGFPSAMVFSVDAGVTAVYSQKLRFVFSMRNLNAPSLLGSPDNTSRGGELGAAFVPMRGMLAALSLVKNTGEDLFFRAGIEFKPVALVSVRAGGQSGTRSRFTTGLGVHVMQMEADYGFIWQSGTGAQSVFSVSWGASHIDTLFVKNEEQTANSGGSPGNDENRININTASVDELDAVPGFGPATAKNIVKYREEHGLFKSVDELRSIPRMSEKIMRQAQGFLTATPPEQKKGPGSLDINTIKLKELIDLNILPLTAVKIIKYRDEKGTVSSFDELKNIQGLSGTDLEQARPVLLPLFKSGPATNRTESKK
jgi:competence ComEA-like helix-hairpin-helix protein